MSTPPPGCTDTGVVVTILRTNGPTQVIPVYAANTPGPEIWPQVRDLLARLVLPKARAQAEAEQAERNRAMGIPEYVEEGI